MPTYRLTLEYDGTEFHGWQFQPRTRTVEGALRDALHAVGEPAPRITAAGRTDAGAHAHGQITGVTTGRDWDPTSLAAALNAELPDDVVVVAAATSVADFHARHDARRRTYRYLISCRDRRAAVTRRHAWTVRGPLDAGAMRAAARHLLGEHDFAAFGAATAPAGSTVRTVHEATVERMATGAPGVGPGFDIVVMTVQANAFLRGMMRAIAGALVAVGQGRMSADAVADMLTTPSARPPALTVAPAHGLHQWAVTYDEAA
jgi:tRNA pseudouridine38-40 synthase